MADEVTLQRVLHDARRDELIDASEADSRKWRIVTHRHLIGSVAGFAIGLGVFMKHRVRVWPALRVAVACKVAEMTVTRVNFEVVRRDTSWHPGEHSYSYFEYNPFSADEVNMVSRRELSYRCETMHRTSPCQHPCRCFSSPT